MSTDTERDTLSVPARDRVYRILLVADDESDIRSVERHLRSSGFATSIDSTRDPLEAQSKLDSIKYDCIFLDCHLPGGDAFELFGDVLAAPCSQRPSVVILTDMHDDGIAAESVQRGAQAYLSKTELNPTTLRRVVESACDKADMQRILERRNEQLLRLSFYDSLTGLPNRQLFFDRLGQAQREAERAGKSFAILLMNLNLFKQINDTFGHDAGDELLRQVAQRLQSVIRDADTVARLCSDEFAALLSTAQTLEGAVIVAEKIHAALSERFEIDGNVAHIDVSIGIALYREHTDKVDALIRFADIAMHEAKSNRSGVWVYGVQNSDGGYKAAMIARGLKSALQEHQLFLMYQPQIRLQDNRLVGAEALVRWQHPQLGLVPPGKFIPAAERSEIIEALTLDVLAMALEQSRNWHEQGLDLRISANLSARLLDREEFADRVKTLFGRIDVPPHKLCLEVTETGIMQSPDRAERTLTALSSLGIQLSIDDFGTGYSSLKYLRNFPINEIKIDRLFVSGVGTEARDDLIVESILALGKAFQVGVVAEGIEDDATWDHLRHLGCDFGQGYAIAAPMRATDFDNWRLLWELGRQSSLPPNEIHV